MPIDDKKVDTNAAAIRVAKNICEDVLRCSWGGEHEIRADDLNALLAERNLLLADKVRLDWLNAQRRQNFPDWGYANGSYYWHVYSASNNTKSMDGARLDLREAIDDVMNGRG